jgi:hypothetical protein
MASLYLMSIAAKVGAEVFMSKINGDKARTAIEQRRRTTQRAKDRARRAEIAQAATKPAAAKKESAK